MKNLQINKLKKGDKRFIKKAFYILLFFATLFAIWQLLAITVFAHSSALPDVGDVLESFFSLAKTSRFYRAVGATLLKSVVSFFVAFVLGAFLALAASLGEGAGYYIGAFITLLRSVPTLGVTFILLMLFRGGTAAMIVAALMSLPLSFSGFSAALCARDKKIYQMARVYNVSRIKTFFRIFLPSSSSYIYEALKAGMGLNLKVIIAAEIISIPRVSIGSGIYSAYVSGNFAQLFAYVAAAVILCFIVEAVIKSVAAVLMPYRGRAGKIDKI